MSYDFLNRTESHAGSFRDVHIFVVLGNGCEQCRANTLNDSSSTKALPMKNHDARQKHLPTACGRLGTCSTAPIRWA